MSINNKVSDTLKITCGVPQGSVLGPILFLLYINNFNLGSGSGSIHFADDTTILVKDREMKTVYEKITAAQESALTWFGKNGLSLNETKTKTILFSHKTIEQQESSIFLGFCLDPILSWEHHVEFIAAKLSKSIFVIRSLRNELPRQSLLTAYHSIFLSHCKYGLLAWGHSPHANRIFGLQRKVLRVIFGMGYRKDVAEVYTKNKLFTIPSLYIYTCLKYVRENLGSYTINSDIHNHNTRQNLHINIQKLRLSLVGTG